MDFGLPFNYIHNASAGEGGSLLNPLGFASRSGDEYADQRTRSAERSSLQAQNDAFFARVEGLKAQGIHPLAASGVTANFSGTPLASSDPGVGHFSMGSRAPRQSDADRQMEGFNLRRAAADADLSELQVEAARRRLAGQPGNSAAPPVAPVGAVEVKPSEVTSRMPGTLYAEAGTTPAGQYMDTPVGRLWVPKADALTEMELLSYGMMAADLIRRNGGVASAQPGVKIDPKYVSAGGGAYRRLVPRGYGFNTGKYYGQTVRSGVGASTFRHPN